MEFTIDHYLYIAVGGIIPLIIALFIKKKYSSSNKNIPPNEKLSGIELRIKKLEDDVIKNHIDLDEVRLDLATIKGRLRL